MTIFVRRQIGDFGLDDWMGAVYRRFYRPKALPLRCAELGNVSYWRIPLKNSAVAGARLSWFNRRIDLRRIER